MFLELSKSVAKNLQNQFSEKGILTKDTLSFWHSTEGTLFYASQNERIKRNKTYKSQGQAVELELYLHMDQSIYLTLGHHKESFSYAVFEAYGRTLDFHMHTKEKRFRRQGISKLFLAKILSLYPETLLIPSSFGYDNLTIFIKHAFRGKNLFYNFVQSTRTDEVLKYNLKEIYRKVLEASLKTPAAKLRKFFGFSQINHIIIDFRQNKFRQVNVEFQKPSEKATIPKIYIRAQYETEFLELSVDGKIKRGVVLEEMDNF
ncbi:MAG: hypothetical protein VX642_15890 [Bdellovibrionota bacterium]|nr:hypothetical protein [Bdellovibrionota bacterium]